MVSSVLSVEVGPGLSFIALRTKVSDWMFVATIQFRKPSERKELRRQLAGMHFRKPREKRNWEGHWLRFDFGSYVKEGRFKELEFRSVCLV